MVFPLVLFSDVWRKQSRAKPFSKQQALFINKSLDSRNLIQIYYWNADPPKKRTIFKILGGVIIRQPTLQTIVYPDWAIDGYSYSFAIFDRKETAKQY